MPSWRTATSARPAASPVSRRPAVAHLSWATLAHRKMGRASGLRTRSRAEVLCEDSRAAGTLRHVEKRGRRRALQAPPVTSLIQNTGYRPHQPVRYRVTASIAEAAQRVRAVVPTQKGGRHVLLVQQWQPRDADDARQIHSLCNQPTCGFYGISDHGIRPDALQNGRCPVEQRATESGCGADHPSNPDWPGRPREFRQEVLEQLMPSRTIRQRREANRVAGYEPLGVAHVDQRHPTASCDELLAQHLQRIEVARYWRGDNGNMRFVGGQFHSAWPCLARVQRRERAVGTGDPAKAGSHAPTSNHRHGRSRAPKALPVIAPAHRRNGSPEAFRAASSRFIRSRTSPRTPVPSGIGRYRLPEVGGAGGAVVIWAR